MVGGVILVLPFALLDPDLISSDGMSLTSTVGSWLTVASQALFFAGMVAWPLITGVWKADGWRRAFGFVVSWRALWVGAVGGVATLIAMIALTELTSRLLDRPVDSAGAEVADAMSETTVAYVLFLLLIAFGAPFVEEIAFRGLVWGAVVKRGWSPWLATVIAGVPFALLHIEPVRIAPLVAAGLVLGTVRQFGGLGASMLAHAIVNCLGVIGILLAELLGT
jgi:hypothetical protein